MKREKSKLDWPLRMTPLELYMLLDDRPQHPMLCDHYYDLSGHLDRSAFEDALQEVVARHPLFTARYDLEDGYWWKDPGGFFPPLSWNDHSASRPAHWGRRFDLRNESGLRLWVRQDGQRVTLQVQFHHAVCDGVGALRFVSDLLMAHAARVSGQPQTWPEVDPDVLTIRGDYGEKVESEVSLLPGTPTPLHASQFPIFRGDLPDLCSVRMEQAVTEGLRDAATRLNANQHDLLLRELLGVVADWNEPCSHSDNEFYRVVVPQHLLDERHAAMPAALGIGYGLVDVRRSACANPDALLDSIATQMSNIRRNKMGRFLAGFLEPLLAGPPAHPIDACICGMRAEQVGAEQCLSTLIFSYLGNMERFFPPSCLGEDGHPRFGGLRLGRNSGSAPVRPFTRVGVTAGNIGGKLGMSVRMDPRLYNREDGHRFLVQLRDRVIKVAGVASSAEIIDLPLSS